MLRRVSENSAITAPGATEEPERDAGFLGLRIGELAREERVAVLRGDWVTARSKALERARLREAHHRNVVRRWA